MTRADGHSDVISSTAVYGGTDRAKTYLLFYERFPTESRRPFAPCYRVTRIRNPLLFSPNLISSPPRGTRIPPPGRP